MRKLKIETLSQRNGIKLDVETKLLLPNKKHGDDMNRLFLSGIPFSSWIPRDKLIWLRDALNTLLPDRYPNEGQVADG